MKPCKYSHIPTGYTDKPEHTHIMHSPILNFPATTALNTSVESECTCIAEIPCSCNFNTYTKKQELIFKRSLKIKSINLKYYTNIDLLIHEGVKWAYNDGCSCI